MNTCYPARIVSFDALTQTAVVKLMIERYFSDFGENYKVLPTQELVDVPCHFPKGGGHAITMPVVAGDDCLVFFAQKGIDHWLYEGDEETGGLLERPSPQHKRHNSLSDALALIGFGSGIVAETPKVITDFQVNAIEIRNEDRTQRISLVVDTKDIEIVTSANVVATIEGDITATCANANIEATTLITLKAPDILLDGDVEFTGKMLDKNGIDHVVHKHDKGDYKDAESRPLKSGSTGEPE
jgi:hypothetical protein